MKPRPFRVALVALVLVLMGAGLWLVRREVSCGDRFQTARAFGDAEVRRDRLGQCYICRRDGPLYDIAFARCVAGDEIVTGV